MTESHPMPGAVLPFDPDAPPAPSRTFCGLTLAAALFYRDAAIAAGAVFPAEDAGV